MESHDLDLLVHENMLKRSCGSTALGILCGDSSRSSAVKNIAVGHAAAQSPEEICDSRRRSAVQKSH